MSSLLLCLCALLTACGQQSGSERAYEPNFTDRPGGISQEIRYTFAVHPLHNPKRLFAKYQPLINLINEEARGFSIKLVASRDYATFEKRLYAGRFHFALPNPLQTLRSLDHDYRVIAKMGDDEMFRGIIIMRRDAGVMFVEDLVGADLSFPAPTALAATMLPKHFLQSRGLDLARTRIHYVGSQESAIMNVYLGKTVAAGTWPLPWELMVDARPELNRELMVKWMTPPLVNNGLVARTNIPREHIEQLLRILYDLPNHPRGVEILKGIHVSRFEPASAETYAPVLEFLKDYREMFPEEETSMGGER